MSCHFLLEDKEWEEKMDIKFASGESNFSFEQGEVELINMPQNLVILTIHFNKEFI